MSVLVIGATGNIGRLVVSAVLDRGTEVVGFCRQAERGQEPAGLDRAGVRLAYGDLRDPESVRKAAAGCDAIFVLTPHSPNQVELQGAAIAAAADTGARVVKISSWTPSVYADTPVPGSWRHFTTQQQLIDREVPFTILGPNYFMHNLVNRYAPDVQARGLLLSPAGDRGISMVDARDVAEAAATVLTESGHEGCTYTLSGPSAPTYSEIARQLTELTGRDVTYYDMNDNEFRIWMAAQGRQDWETDHAAAIFALYREGIGELVTSDVETLTGHPARSIESFLQERKADFLPAG